MCLVGLFCPFLLFETIVYLFIYLNLTWGEDLEEEDIFILPFLFKPEKNFQGRNFDGITKDYPKKCPRESPELEGVLVRWPFAYLNKHVQVEV